MPTLVFDVGMSIIGIQNSNGGRYIPYYGDGRKKALERLERACEIVTYNGNRYDLKELNTLSLSLRGKGFKAPKNHIDIREKFWPNILGKCLGDTFNDNVASSRVFPDTYEGSNQADVYRTWMLWKHWNGTLRSGMVNLTT